MPDDQRPRGESPLPEDAAAHFRSARAAHDAAAYEEAMRSWLRGLRRAPASVPGLEGLFRSASAFLRSDEPAKGMSADTSAEFNGRGDLERYLASLLNWAAAPANALLAVRAAEAASALRLFEPTYWIGERALKVIAGERRPRKEHFLRMMKVFGDIGAFDKAVGGGDSAIGLGPGDGPPA